MIESKTKEINGIQFTVTPFRAVEAFKLKAYLLKKFAPAFSQALGILKDGIPENGKWMDLKIDGDVISKAVKELLIQLDESELISLLKRLLQNVRADVEDVNGKPLELYFVEKTFDASLDIVFGGRTFTVYPVLLFVLEANFPDFFEQMGGFGGKIQAIVTSEPQEPKSEKGSKR